MDIFIALLVGVVIGGVGMFLIYRNNKKKFEKAEAELKEIIIKLKK